MDRVERICAALDDELARGRVSSRLHRSLRNAAVDPHTARAWQRRKVAEVLHSRDDYPEEHLYRDIAWVTLSADPGPPGSHGGDGDALEAEPPRAGLPGDSQGGGYRPRSIGSYALDAMIVMQVCMAALLLVTPIVTMFAMLVRLARPRTT